MPRDAFYGAGAEDQILLVVPSLDLICVRNGGKLAAQESEEDARARHLFEPLMAALGDR